MFAMKVVVKNSADLTPKKLQLTHLDIMRFKICLLMVGHLDVMQSKMCLEETK